MKESVVKMVVQKFGGQLPLAEYLGVTKQAVATWGMAGRLPPERAIQLERKSGGVFRAIDLCPELDQEENE